MSVRSEIEKLTGNFAEAVTRGDVAALAAFYAEDARFMPPGAPMVEGVAAIVAAQRNIIRRGVQALNLESVDVSEAGEFAIEIGRVTMTMRTSVGGSVTVSGKSIVVWRRQRDGGLKIVADIFNSNSPG